MDAFQKDLQTVQYLHGLRSQVETAGQANQQALKSMPSKNQIEEWKMQLESLREAAPIGSSASSHVAADIHGFSRQLTQQTSTLQERLELIKNQTNELGALAEQDLNFVKAKLSLPKVEMSDLTYALFGSPFLNQLEKLAYWSIALREKMPVGVNHKGIRVVQQNKEIGRSFHFGTEYNSPSLWIQKIEFDSELEPSSSRGRVKGALSGLTLDPLILGAATTLTLDADFPNSGVTGLHLEAKIDHAGVQPQESFKLNIRSFNLENWIIQETPDYKFKMNSGRASVLAEGTLDHDSTDVRWEFAADETELSLSSRYKAIEDTLKQVVQSHTEFVIKGQALGANSNIDFQMQSEMGKRIGSELAHSFKQQIVTLDEGLKNRILDNLVPLRQEIFEKIGEIETSQIATMTSTQGVLQALEQDADKLVNEFEQKPQVISRRIRRHK